MGRNSHFHRMMLTATVLFVTFLAPVGWVATADQPDRETTRFVAQDPPTVQEAQSLQGAGRWDEAAEAWRQITEADSENGNAWFNLGYCLHLGGRLDEAIPVHQTASTFDDYKGIALYNLGCAYALNDQPDMAFEALFESQEAGFSMRGQAEYDSDLDSLHSDPRFAALFTNEPVGFWGNVQRKIGQAQQVVQHEAPRILFQVQQTVQREAPRIKQQLSLFAQLAQQAAGQSIGQVQQIFAEDDRFTRIAQRLGGLLAHENSHSESAVDYDSILKQANKLQNEQRWLEAAETYRVATQIEPENPMPWFNLAYCLHMGEAYDEAIPAHQKAAAFEAVRGVALYNLACAYALTEKLDEAMKALQASREAGFDLAGAIAQDRDLDNLRDDPGFIELMTELGLDY